MQRSLQAYTSFPFLHRQESLRVSYCKWMEAHPNERHFCPHHAQLSIGQFFTESYPSSKMRSWWITKSVSNNYTHMSLWPTHESVARSTHQINFRVSQQSGHLYAILVPEPFNCDASARVEKWHECKATLWGRYESHSIDVHAGEKMWKKVYTCRQFLHAINEETGFHNPARHPFHRKFANCSLRLLAKRYWVRCSVPSISTWEVLHLLMSMCSSSFSFVTAVQ